MGRYNLRAYDKPADVFKYQEDPTSQKSTRGRNERDVRGEVTRDTISC